MFLKVRSVFYLLNSKEKGRHMAHHLVGPKGRFDLPFDSPRLQFEFELKYYSNILIRNSSPKIVILL